MVRVSISFTRPSLYIPWHIDPGSNISTYELKKTFMTEFMIPLKITYLNRITSEDDLTLTTIGYWDSLESLSEYENSPIFSQLLKKRNAYYLSRNCTVGILNIEEVPSIRKEDLILDR